MTSWMIVAVCTHPTAGPPEIFNYSYEDEARFDMKKWIEAEIAKGSEVTRQHGEHVRVLRHYHDDDSLEDEVMLMYLVNSNETLPGLYGGRT